MITCRVVLCRHGKPKQGGKAMGFPKRADIGAGPGQYIQRMRFGGKGAMPIALWRGQGLGIW
jgi:hypothetical protein